jgi:hypothetical protein
MDTSEHESIVRRSFLIRENWCSFVVKIGIGKGASSIVSGAGERMRSTFYRTTNEHEWARIHCPQVFPDS